MSLTDKQYLDWKIGLLKSDLDAIAQILKMEKDIEKAEKDGIQEEVGLIKRWIDELKAEQK